MPSRRLARWLRLILICSGAVACKLGADTIQLPELPADAGQLPRPTFVCANEDSVGCEGNVYLSCRSVGEFLQIDRMDCGIDRVCDMKRGCMTCFPGELRCRSCEPGADDCDPNVVQRCEASGSAWEDIETCVLADGDTCYEGRCQNMCQVAKDNRSYVGCEFFAADLDNAAIDDLNNASAQQFAVAVANPQSIAVDVDVEINEAAYGEPVQIRNIEHATVPPGALEVFKLPQREVDGSTSGGLNDGTHTAVSSLAFRVSSSHPVSAYQFNPLENVNVFSNDSSLLLPTSAIGSRYTVVSWPQTIGDSENPEQDFDATSSNEDLRAFLTIIGTQDGTNLTVKLGNEIKEMVGAGPVPAGVAGDQFQISINRFDVINLETAGLNADFTGSVVESDRPITLFVGSEASDAPIFGTYATRQCCADHLEEQLIADATLGSSFIIARTPSRTQALAAAAVEADPLGIAVVNEPEWVRVLGVQAGLTTVTTTLPEPDNRFRLEQGEDTILRADQDFLLQADQPVSVLQVMGSQGVTGIPREYPGGDPSIIVVPPIQQYRRDYIFLTPDKYAFDFVTIMADATATILLDGAPLPDTCETAPADGITRGEDTPPADQVIHRCQLSFPIVTRGPNSRVLPGDQHDGVHTILSDEPCGIVVSGFDRFVSHAYPGGLNLQILN
jgi:hypothetical protein